MDPAGFSPRSKTVSHAAEVRMAEEEKLKRQKKTVPLSEKAGETVEQLLEAKEYLEQKPVLFTELSNAARKKRHMNRQNLIINGERYFSFF